MVTPMLNSDLKHGRSIRFDGAAFSLIELILVLTIISILAAIAVPRYAEALSRYRVDAAANRVVADLEYARNLARSSGSSVTVHVLADSDTVKIIGVADEDDPAAGYFTDLARQPYHADVVTSQFNSDSVLIYDGYGYPDSTGSVVICVGSYKRMVEVDLDSGKAAVK